MDILKREEADAQKLRLIKKILYTTKRRSEEFSADELRIIKLISAENILRDRVGPFKPLPVSWKIWGPVIPVTWHLPKAIVEWRYSVGPKTVKNVFEAIRKIIQDCFAEDGKYIVSSYHYPHWGVTSDKYPPLHFHGVIGSIRFLEADRKVRRGTSKVKVWEQSSHQGKAELLPSFFQCPRIVIDEKERANIERLYHERLKDIFGASTMVHSEDRFWCGDDCIIDYKGLFGKAHYMRNPLLNILRHMAFRYIEDKDSVLVRHLDEPDDDAIVTYRDAHLFDVVDFVKRYLLTPLKGFWGKRFYASGAYHHKSAFNKVLKFANDNPDVLGECYWSGEKAVLPDELIAGFEEN